MELRLLGGWRLSSGDTDLTPAIRYRKGWALLGYLAIERGRRHSREQVAELLWPALDPAAARTNLRQVLADLNHAFDRYGGRGVLETSREGVGFFPQLGISVDVVALEALHRAPLDAGGEALVEAERQADRWAGEFMAGFQLPDCSAFEAWLEAARRRLAGSALETLTRLCRAQLAQGRAAQAIISARQLVALDEWQEEHQRQLMQLLAAAGLHAQALAQYRSLEASLQAELGTSPEPRTQALYRRLQVEHRRARAEAGAGSPLIRRAPRQDGAEGLSPDDDGIELLTQHTLPVGAAAGGGPPARGWLEVEHGIDRGRRIAVGSEPVVVGRSRDSQLQIPQDTVSRQHCAIWYEREEGFRVRDLGSTNGTRVNDAVVQEAALRAGDRIVLGDTVLRFDCGTAPDIARSPAPSRGR